MRAQVDLLHATCRQQQELLERVLAHQGHQLSLIEQQNNLILAVERAHQQRLEGAAVESFSLDHENIELRQRLRAFGAPLPADAGDAAPERLPY